MKTADDSSPSSAFIDWEHRQDERWESVAGIAQTVLGGNVAHSQIANNIRAALHCKLHGTDFSYHGPLLKVLTLHGDVMYPDAFVRRRKGDLSTEAVDEPLVVFEVLSTSTAQHDLTRKRLAYKTIPSLRLIVYVAQDRARLDIVRRQPDGRWDDDEPVVGMAGALAIPEVDVSLAMSEIYEDVELVDEANA